MLNRISVRQYISTDLKNIFPFYFFLILLLISLIFSLEIPFIVFSAFFSGYFDCKLRHEYLEKTTRP